MLVLIFSLTFSFFTFDAFANDCSIKEDKNWYKCEKNHECTLVDDPCDGLIAVNMKFEKVAEKYFSCAKMWTSCESFQSTTATPDLKVRCLVNKCEIIK